MKDKEFNSKGDRVTSRDNDGYTCRVDSSYGTCSNNRTGESVNVARDSDGKWGFDTSNTGPKNIMGNSNSNSNKDWGSFYGNDKDYGEYSEGGGNYTGGSYSSYTPQQAHITSIVNTIKYSGGTLVGGVVDGSRMKKGDNSDVNYYLMEPIQRMHREKVVGNEHLKGMVFHDCYLTGNDMDYIMNMPDWVDYNFKIIDFSNNLGINDLGIQYALRGNCSHDDGIKYKGFLGRDRLHVVKLDLSNCNISDGGASLIAEALSDGKLASTKCINLAGNNITDTGKGFIIKAIDKINHGISVTLETIQNVSKETFKISVKAMLSIAKNNGISTKEALTTEETIEHCKKGIPNVGKNMGIGIAKCSNSLIKYTKPNEVTLQDIGIDILGFIVPQIKPVTNSICYTEKIAFSIVDEEFANCLSGLDSNLNN